MNRAVCKFVFSKGGSHEEGATGRADVVGFYATEVVASEVSASSPRTITVQVQCTSDFKRRPFKVESRVVWNYDDVTGRWKAKLQDIRPEYAGDIATIASTVAFEILIWTDGNKRNTSGYDRRLTIVHPWRGGEWNAVNLETNGYPATAGALLEARVKVSDCSGIETVPVPSAP